MNDNYFAVKKYSSMVNSCNLHKWEDQGLSQQSSGLHVSLLSERQVMENWPIHFKWKTEKQIKRQGRKWKLHLLSGEKRRTLSLPLDEYSQQLLGEAPRHRNPHRNHGAAMAPVKV